MGFLYRSQSHSLKFTESRPGGIHCKMDMCPSHLVHLLLQHGMLLRHSEKSVWKPEASSEATFQVSGSHQVVKAQKRGPRNRGKVNAHTLRPQFGVRWLHSQVGGLLSWPHPTAQFVPFAIEFSFIRDTPMYL